VTIKKILIANRGEIAIRIARACRELGIPVVAIYSDADRSALHVRMADEAYGLGGVKVSESYLKQESIIDIARACGADAIHPGYGLLSENKDFAKRVEESGLIFIGPPSEAIGRLGDKTAARALARSLGVPTIQGTTGSLGSDSEALAQAEAVGFPVLLKAAAGGGGKGMRIVSRAEEFPSMLRSARSEAKSSFGDDRVYVEKYIANPRHVEMQILADAHGNASYLGERDCSIQRRHQKVIEESPSPIMDPDLRKTMGEAAVRVVLAGGYRNAGTVEFLVDQEKNFYFLEVNTRLQVEHPVTELVTGIDLVKEQISIAEGKPLSYDQKAISLGRHAIECRIYAEDPENQFLPSTGTLALYDPPEGPRVRVDNGMRQGDKVELFYDPLLAKVITWGPTRQDAIATMQRALGEFRVAGVSTTIPFCQFVLANREFQAGRYTTHFVEEHFTKRSHEHSAEEQVNAAILAALFFSQRQQGPEKGGQDPKANGLSRWKQRRQEHLH
jgi:acetyl-CoA carboxylase, biotin carboxylase subunit